MKKLIVTVIAGRVDGVSVIDVDTGEIAKVASTHVEIVYTLRDHNGRCTVTINSPHIHPGDDFILEVRHGAGS